MNLEAEPIVSVMLHISHNGSLFIKEQEFSLLSTVGQLKEDMEKEVPTCNCQCL